MVILLIFLVFIHQKLQLENVENILKHIKMERKLLLSKIDWYRYTSEEKPIMNYNDYEPKEYPCILIEWEDMGPAGNWFYLYDFIYKEEVEKLF
jgi:hypothetical protein